MKNLNIHLIFIFKVTRRNLIAPIQNNLPMKSKVNLNHFRFSTNVPKNVLSWI